MYSGLGKSFKEFGRLSVGSIEHLICVVLVERAVLVSATCQGQLEEVHSYLAQRSTSERFISNLKVSLTS